MKNFLFNFFILGKLYNKLLNKLKSEQKSAVTDDESFKARERLRILTEKRGENFSEALIDDLLNWKKEKH